MIPSAAGCVQLAGDGLAAAAEQVVLQLLRQMAHRGAAANPPSTYSLGKQITEHPVIRAAMAAMAAGKLTLKRSPMSAAVSQLRIEHGGVLTGADPDASGPRLLLESSDGQRQGAVGATTALVEFEGYSTDETESRGWHRGESDTDTDDATEDMLVVSSAAGAPGTGDGALPITASSSATVAVSAASAVSNTPTMAGRLTSLTGALMPADGAPAPAVPVLLPPLSLLTWNIWHAVCACDAVTAPRSP